MLAEAGLLTGALTWALFLSAPLVNAAANVDKSSVGALTSLSAKSTVCNVLDYGGVADGKTDIGPAIIKAYKTCVSGNAATLYVPEGDYSLATGVTLSGASGWAFQLDGLITLTSDGAFNGNGFIIEDGSDIEFFSSNNLGAINGQGYIMRRDSTGQNARLVRFISTSNVAIHNIILIDAPTFHLVLNDVSNLDLYYITIRGGDIGATDGIDLICTDNCYLHEFEVTNRDECVSVKSPSNNVLIEEAYCNHSGGMSIGSLTANIDDEAEAAAVSNITMRNIYSTQCTEMLMIKTYPGGTGAEGYVKDCLFENFFGYDTTYALDIDQYWQGKTSPDTGAVALSDLTFRNWTGSLANGIQRGAVIIRGSDIVPLQNIVLEDFDMWSLYSDKVVNQCKNVYGNGMCIQATSGTATYTTSVTSTVKPTGWTAPAAPTWAVTGYGTTDAIPIYTPAVFWPTASSGSEAAAVSATATSSASVIAVSSAVKVASIAASSSIISNPVASSTPAASQLNSTSSLISTSKKVSTAASTFVSSVAASSASTTSTILADAVSRHVASGTGEIAAMVNGTSSASYLAPVVTSGPEVLGEAAACPAPAIVTVYV